MEINIIDGRQKPLLEVFSAMASRRFLFVRPGGNWGDQLIYLGAEHLASQLALKWRSLDHADFSDTSAEPGEVIYLHGGGGYTTLASGRAVECLLRALNTPGATVIQGPCTISDRQTLENLQDNFQEMRADRLYFFTRERKSSTLLQECLPPRTQHFLNEDTAFYLTRACILKEARPRSQSRMHLFAVREDLEAVSSCTISDFGNTVLDPAYFARSFEHWLRIHIAAKTIVTNRTHSAICGSILGIPTTLFAGAYHKNLSVWQFSLEHRGVHWLDDTGTIPQKPSVDSMLSWIPIPAVKHSWKLDRWAKYLRGIPIS
jgi:exopolysaccharide biosynthesis predicted pyruvyltransferase EpsI